MLKQEEHINIIHFLYFIGRILPFAGRENIQDTERTGRKAPSKNENRWGLYTPSPSW